MIIDHEVIQCVDFGVRLLPLGSNSVPLTYNIDSYHAIAFIVSQAPKNHLQVLILLNYRCLSHAKEEELSLCINSPKAAVSSLGPAPALTKECRRRASMKLYNVCIVIFLLFVADKSLPYVFDI